MRRIHKTSMFCQTAAPSFAERTSFILEPEQINASDHLRTQSVALLVLCSEYYVYQLMMELQKLSSFVFVSTLFLSYTSCQDLTRKSYRQADRVCHFFLASKSVCHLQRV